MFFNGSSPGYYQLYEAIPNWQSIQAEVTRRCSNISRMPITAFTRGCASSSYAVSKLLFQAEFSGLPRATELARIKSNIAALVEHKRDPPCSESDSDSSMAPTSLVTQKMVVLECYQYSNILGRGMQCGLSDWQKDWQHQYQRCQHGSRQQKLQ